MNAAVWLLAAVVGGLVAFVCLMSSELKAVNKRAKDLMSRVVMLEGEAFELRNRCAGCTSVSEELSHG